MSEILIFLLLGFVLISLTVFFSGQGKNRVVGWETAVGEVSQIHTYVSVLCEYTEIVCSAGAFKIIDSFKISMDQLHRNQIRLERLASFVHYVNF